MFGNPARLKQGLVFHIFPLNVAGNIISGTSARRRGAVRGRSISSGCSNECVAPRQRTLVGKSSIFDWLYKAFGCTLGCSQMPYITSQILTISLPRFAGEGPRTHSNTPSLCSCHAPHPSSLQRCHLLYFPQRLVEICEKQDPA